ncbi:ImmA/IrrE family metallo-endopeptidase [Streptosporangium nondiastaticum]|uniref:ImmA/IrrE family metallo-endopeptidase n=1 Tax=Streptosporangium nondiastaticum TaxID=35764 RepID=UPI001CB89A1B|nr:ImmA/IrrE family metallo-endopeptidase [Streptosporangium nondiastaticum]
MGAHHVRAGGSGSAAAGHESRRALRRLRRGAATLLTRLELPDRCDIVTLCEHLSRERGRPLHLAPVIMGASYPCGMWVALDTADIVIFEANTSRLHQDHIIAHELAHMICSHRGDTDPAGSSGLSSMFPHLDAERVREALGRTSYSTEEEQEAEIMASLILEHVTRPPLESRWAVPSVDAETVARIERSL